MKPLLRLLFVPLLLTSLTLAQMQLKLSNDFEKRTISTTLESKNQLILPNTTVAPPDAMDFYKGMIFLGLMADVTFPMGSDFKHISGTAFSGHVVAGYLVSPEFLLALKAGYVKFATQTEEGSDLGFTYKYEDSFSQIPILFGGYYVFPSGSGFKPYIGLALGVFFQTYKVNWQEDYGTAGTWSLDQSFTNTAFGIVPAVGFYYLLGSAILQASVEYNLLLSNSPAADYTFNYTLAKGTGVNSITQEYSESYGKASSVSVNFGVAFPLGK